MGQCNFKFVKTVVAGFVDARRLAGRADEQAGEQVGQRRVTLPVKDKAFQKIGSAQKRTVCQVCPAHDDVVAAARARVASIDHELVSAKPGLAGFLIDRLGGCYTFFPVSGWMNVDFDDTWIRCDPNYIEALVLRRSVAFDMDRKAKIRSRLFSNRNQFQIVFNPFNRWHENTKPAIARLYRNGCAYRATNFAQNLLNLFGPRRCRLERGFAERAFFRFKIGQWIAFDRWVRRMNVRELRWWDIGQGAQRQAIANG